MFIQRNYVIYEEIKLYINNELDIPKTYGKLELFSVNICDTVFSVIYGGIVGDALGVPYEFCERGTFKVETMTGYGTHNQPLGTWSDDTSLTLCLIKNIIEGGDEKTLLGKFMRYFEKGDYTPYGSVFDIGYTTQQAILRYKRGFAPECCGGRDENSNGNGSLMRITPLVFVLRNTTDFTERVKIVKRYSELTHGHPRSILACIIYIEILHGLLNGCSLEQAVGIASKYCVEHLKSTEYENEFHHYKRIFDGTIKTVPIENIKSSGYVVHTLEAALWSCLHSGNFKEAILTAVNLGDDTDTVGSITGSIAGMQYKAPVAIPADWLSALVQKEKIDILIGQFCEYLENDTVHTPPATH